MPISSTTPASLPLYWTLVLVDVLGGVFRWPQPAMRGHRGDAPLSLNPIGRSGGACKSPVMKSVISNTPSGFNCALSLGARNKRGAMVSNTTAPQDT